MGVFGPGGGVFCSRGFTGLPPADLPPQPSSAAISCATGTRPRAIFATVGEYLQADTGASQTTNQYFATRTKIRLSGGKWMAIAPIFMGSYLTSQRSAVGSTSPAFTVSFAIELADGSMTSGYSSSNNGGTVFQGFFSGSVDGIVRPGDIVVGDWVYASDMGLEYFDFPDRTYLPWVRCAFSKSAATDTLGAQARQEYNSPWNCHFAACSTYSNAKTLIATPGINNYNGGANLWGATDAGTLPGPIGFIGIPVDGQKAVMFFGTSICDGAGYSNMQGGVDPAYNQPRNYDLKGFPSVWAQDLSRSIPVLNFAVGSSAMWRVFSDNSTDGGWSSAEPISRQRANLARLACFFDVIIAHDVHNEGAATGSYEGILLTFTKTMRSQNPWLKIFGCRVPNGCLDINGADVPYASASLDPRWSAQDGMVETGWWDGMLSAREVGSDQYPDLGVQLNSVSTSTGTTTTLIDSTSSWLTNQWQNCWVQVAGAKRQIIGNTRTQLTFAALPGAVGNATPYTIEGNTTHDGIHPNALGMNRLAANFDTSLQARYTIPKFTRSA